MWCGHHPRPLDIFVASGFCAAAHDRPGCFCHRRAWKYETARLGRHGSVFAGWPRPFSQLKLFDATLRPSTRVAGWWLFHSEKRRSRTQYDFMDLCGTSRHEQWRYQPITSCSWATCHSSSVYRYSHVSCRVETNHCCWLYPIYSISQVQPLLDI